MNHISGIVGWLIIIIILAWMFLGNGKSKPANHNALNTEDLRERFRKLISRSDMTNIQAFINRQNAGLFATCLCSFIRDTYNPLINQLHYEDITRLVRHLLTEHEVNQLLKAAHNGNYLRYENGTVYLYDRETNDLLIQLFTDAKQ
ncbi:hypothetical protein ACFOQM_07350 [Paenibacillus sp. GCM10012307]|uniref:Uncharacterized protein n=1 Tax=Paenibacillus roseus TaxID=2798579 RepID=A0A934J6B0_9BACL|nr:hypothetical protein [Paenibacillus roseus]MBJ6361108.1 hypothetical protein [Paenibacillus roseus]